MKINSSLADTSLYGRNGRDQRPPANTSRRLLTLILGLVMVLVLMKQAGDPAVYRRLFNRLGVPMTNSMGEEVVTVPVDLPIETSQVTQSKDMAPVVAKLSTQVRTRLTEMLAQIRRDEIHEDREQYDDLIEHVARVAGQVSGDLGEELSQVLNAVVVDDSDITIEEQQVLQRLQLALDRTYLDTIEDGTVWNAGDFLAFYRSLERVASDTELSPTPVYVGAVPLIEQSVVYRGRHVQISGQAVQSVKFEAEDNLFGIRDYWMVWVRPLDGSERPVVVYAPSVSDAIESLPEDGVDTEGPEVEVDGVFLKRYLYRSVGGYDQAPLLVGTFIELKQEVVADAPVPSAPGNMLVGVFSGAAIFGVLVTAVVLWNSNRSSKRQRELRQKGIRPSATFLTSLESDSNSTST